MNEDRVGFIGLGNMGAAIAERFLAAGLPLTVCDRAVEHTEPFRAGGATVVATPREVADRAEVVFACLPSTQVCLDVALGPEGVARGAAVQVYVDTSTIGTDVASRIAGGLPATTGFLDAPVSGGPPGARAGTLSTMVSGARAHFERVKPLLDVMARQVFYMGETPGQAQVAKLINNHLSAAGRLAAFEGLVMALKAGIDPAALLDAVNHSSGRNTTTTDKIPAAILSGSFTFNTHLGISIKDQTLLREEAAALGVQLWVAPCLLETLKEAASDGYLDRDSMWLVQWMGERAGIDVHALIEARKAAGTEA